MFHNNEKKEKPSFNMSEIEDFDLDLFEDIFPSSENGQQKANNNNNTSYHSFDINNEIDDLYESVELEKNFSSAFFEKHLAKLEHIKTHKMQLDKREKKQGIFPKTQEQIQAEIDCISALQRRLGTIQTQSLERDHFYRTIIDIIEDIKGTHSVGFHKKGGGPLPGLISEFCAHMASDAQAITNEIPPAVDFEDEPDDVDLHALSKKKYDAFFKQVIEKLQQLKTKKQTNGSGMFDKTPVHIAEEIKTIDELILKISLFEAAGNYQEIHSNVCKIIAATKKDIPAGFQKHGGENASSPVSRYLAKKREIIRPSKIEKCCHEIEDLALKLFHTVRAPSPTR